MKRLKTDPHIFITVVDAEIKIMNTQDEPVMVCGQFNWRTITDREFNEYKEAIMAELGIDECRLLELLPLDIKFRILNGLSKLSTN